MLHVHAVTYKGRLSVADLEYIVRKANKLGLGGRILFRIFEESDSEGVHVYFDVTGEASEQRRDPEEA